MAVVDVVVGVTNKRQRCRRAKFDWLGSIPSHTVIIITTTTIIILIIIITIIIIK